MDDNGEDKFDQLIGLLLLEMQRSETAKELAALREDQIANRLKS